MGLPLPKHLSDKLTCRTIHSLLYRDILPDDGLYLPRILAKHQQKLGLAFSAKFTQQMDAQNENPFTDETDTPDDIAYSEIQRQRAMNRDPMDTALSGALADRVRLLWRIHQQSFQKGFWDFTWLLEEGIRRGITWSADYCAVDEINDLNALQATLAARIQGTEVEYVGDLDQAIYGFAGVDPQSILNILPYDRTETMELSHRLTRPVADAAEKILDAASWRSPGIIRTERKGGMYHKKTVIEDVFMRIRNEPSVFSDVYVIGRTNWLVSLARNMAIDMGLNVARTGEEELLKEFCGLITDTPAMLPHRSIPAVTAGFLPAVEYYRKGAKAELLRIYGEDPNGSMAWSRFYTQFGTERLKMSIEGKWDMWYRGKQIDPSKPVVRFDTFHASKGLEASTVLVITDITERVETEGVADEEIRLAYVAVTRGRDHVFPVTIGKGWKNRWIP